MQNNIEEQFNAFSTAVTTLKDALNVSATSALTETFDNLENEKIKVENGAPDKETVKKLSEEYQKLNYDKLTSDQKIHMFTLLTLKALTDDKKDYNLMPTPPLISTIMALLWHHLIKKDDVTVVDPAIGTGMLLYTLIRDLRGNNHSKSDYKLYGIDNDETMLDLADVGAHLSSLNIELFRQDALDPWMIQEPDVVVSDIPVGYYPLDDNVKNYATHAETGHSLAHELFIEQIIKNLRPGGYAFLVVPNSLLSGDVGEKFMPWLAKKVYLKALVELPSRLFQNRLAQKSVLVFQNHGKGIESSKVLMTKVESLDEKALVSFNVKLNEWYTKIDK